MDMIPQFQTLPMDLVNEYTNDDTVERTNGISSKLYGTTIKYARMSTGLSSRWDLDERGEVATLELYEICFI